MTRILVQRGSASSSSSSSSSNQNRSSTSVAASSPSTSSASPHQQVTNTAQVFPAVKDETLVEVQEQNVVDETSEYCGVSDNKSEDVSLGNLNSDRCGSEDLEEEEVLPNDDDDVVGSGNTVKAYVGLSVVDEETDAMVESSFQKVIGTSHPPPPPVPPPKPSSMNSTSRRSSSIIGPHRRASILPGVSSRSSPTGSRPSSPRSHCEGEGYNSADEQSPRFSSSYDDAEREHQFEVELRRVKGLEVRKMLEDGNCLFRAVADQVYGDSELYDLVRQMCIDYMALTTSTVKKGGYSSGDVQAQYIYKNTSFDIKVDTESNISAILTAADIVPSTKTIATLKYPNYESGKLEVQYFHPHASFTAAVGLNKATPIDFSVTLGTPTFALGAEAGYETSSSKLTKYTAGITVTKPDSCASIILGDKGDTIKASYIHYLDQLKRNGAVGEITRKFSTNENTFTVGGSYAIDGLTLLKLKLNNHGSLGAVLQHEVIPKSLVTISSEFDTKALDKTPRFGVSLALKP